MACIKPLLILFLLLPLHLAAKGNRDFDIPIAGSGGAARTLACRTPEFSFHFPQMAGNFRLGIANEKGSLWASEMKEVDIRNEQGKLIYTLKDPILNHGSLTVCVVGLTETNGIILEVEAENIPQSIHLMWSFGGCYGKEPANQTDSKLEPLYCAYNVFSVEGAAFTAYYGESMRLRTIHGITPPDSDIRLCDAHTQQSPVAFFESGKKTDAHALGAATPLINGRKLYFCIYAQRRNADYNYYMLPGLFSRTFNK